MKTGNSPLKFVSLGIDTQEEHFVFLKADSPIVVSEGFEILTRVEVKKGNKKIIASLSTIESDLLKEGQVSLSKSASKDLEVVSGDLLQISHLPPLNSLGLVRSKLHGNRLSQEEFTRIIDDIVQGNYSNIHIASFITACYGGNLNLEEVTFLTKSMADSGSIVRWDHEQVFDKHCLGGVPGNRTTPIVVALVAAAGLPIPKTSSRAITSPAGTADTMSTLTTVELSLNQMKEVLEKESGCISWGSAAGLSPVDDRIIKVERALNIDSEGQMIASILSKKAAVGSTHVVIDIPVGPTAKVRTLNDAHRLKYMITVIGEALGLNIKTLITDGSQPVGNGIGPALEAKDVLAVLHNASDAPPDLIEKSLLIAGTIMEMGGLCPKASGVELASSLLSQGKAWEKFLAICNAQGGIKEVSAAPYQHQVVANRAGKIISIDNRRLARLAKLAGAPYDPAAGIYIYHKLGAEVEQGDPIYSVHSESKGELQYALRYVDFEDSIFEIK